jgi:hypothetical protein
MPDVTCYMRPDGIRIYATETGAKLRNAQVARIWKRNKNTQSLIMWLIFEEHDADA